MQAASTKLMQADQVILVSAGCLTSQGSITWQFRSLSYHQRLYVIRGTTANMEGAWETCLDKLNGSKIGVCTEDEPLSAGHQSNG
ncbi:TPA: hypothetical protein ACH3X2_002142 [Trebouxia sp. C0005]